VYRLLLCALTYYITLLYVFTCFYNYIDFVLCTAYFVFVLTSPHPGLYWIYGNKDNDDDDDHDDHAQTLQGLLFNESD
jgi:hypothetical protein